MSEKPAFASIKTLLDCDPDTNSRMIVRTSDFEQLVTLNKERGEWTKDHEAVLRFLESSPSLSSLLSRVNIFRAAYFENNDSGWWAEQISKE